MKVIKTNKSVLVFLLAIIMMIDNFERRLILCNDMAQTVVVQHYFY